MLAAAAPLAVPPIRPTLAADSVDATFADLAADLFVFLFHLVRQNPAAWAIGGAITLAVIYGLGVRHRTEKGLKERPGMNGVVDDLGHGVAVVIGGTCRTVWRFLSGRQMRGEPRTDAKFWKPGSQSTDPLSATQLGSVGLPGAEAGTGWTTPDWDHLAKRVSSAVRAPWAARALAATGRATEALYGSVSTVARGLRRWHYWRGAGRAAARVGAVAAVIGLYFAPGWTLLALAVVGIFILGTAGLWGAGYEPTDSELYAPGLYASLIQVLRLTSEQQEKGAEHWVHLPDDLTAEGAQITIRVPLHWGGTDGERGLMSQTVHSKVPGEWVADYQLASRTPHVVWSPKPKPKPKPQLPSFVPWKSSGTAHKVYVGKVIQDGEIVDQYVYTETDTPHWGVAGDTGSGKSTVLYIGVVHARQHGGVVDILDTKVNSMAEAHGKSGVRIHTTTRACIGAFAEFMVSILAAERAMEEGADPTLRDQLVPRTLVIDELPTLIRFAYTWWKHGIKQKGAPPFIDWFTIILMMGRSSNHRVVVGSQQFDNALFGGTIGRKQIGTKVVLGRQDMVSWGVAFGQNAPRLNFDTTVKGRGAYADKQMDPDGGDFAWVREFQPAYITPEVAELLDACEKAPQWFDDGEMAPWITPEALAEAQETAATKEFMPGGELAPKAPTVVPGHTSRGVELPRPRSEQGQAAAGLPSETGQGTEAGHVQEEAEDAALPETYTIGQACEEGILPWGYQTARKYMLQRSESRGIVVPEGVYDGKATYYTKAELTEWLAAWQSKSNAKTKD